MRAEGGLTDMQQWEYLFLDGAFGHECEFIPTYQNKKKFFFDKIVCTEGCCSELGKAGWELVQMRDREGGNYIMMVFKRLIEA